MSELIVTAGRLYADIVMTGLPHLPRLGHEDYARDALVAPGGGVFIAASYLRALGRPVEIAAALGDDPISDGIAQKLAQRGLLSPLIERFNGGPQLTVALAVAGDRAFATHRAGPAVPAGLAQRLASGDVRHLHIAELATLLEAPWLIEAARGQNVSVSLDIAWDDAAFADGRGLALARSVDVVFPNRVEAEALTDRIGAPPVELMTALASDGATVVIKRDRDGAVLHCGGGIWAGPALPADVVDATGAGDAFAAGFIDAWLSRTAPAAALARGLACGALAVAATGGAEKLPSRATVLALAEQAKGAVHAEPCAEVQQGGRNGRFALAAGSDG